MTTNNVLEALRAAKARHDHAKAEVERIAASHEQTPAPDTAAINEALASAIRAYEDTAGAHALGDATEADLAQAQSRLDAAQRAANRAHDEALRVRATASGLARRLDAAKAEVAAAAEALREAEIAWLRGELHAVDVEYGEAAAHMAHAWGRAKAVLQAIRRRGVTRGFTFVDLARQPTVPLLGVARDEHEHKQAMNRALAVDHEQVEARLAKAMQAID